MQIDMYIIIVELDAVNAAYLLFGLYDSFVSIDVETNKNAGGKIKEK